MTPPRCIGRIVFWYTCTLISFSGASSFTVPSPLDTTTLVVSNRLYQVPGGNMAFTEVAPSSRTGDTMTLEPSRNCVLSP
uniref:Secreted protein n=1 Tax=Arundo donax TaxID=35708 RepID=A0A0A9EIV6_ARUDO